MNINTQSGVSPILYTRGATLASQTISQRQESSIYTTEEAVTASYHVTISSKGVDQSLSHFESGQENDKKAFERRLSQEENSKIRELDAEKRRFDQSQATEKNRFEESQRIEKIRFQQQNPT